jgi:predicted nuclease of predicted toxin-antitoxin system
MNASFRSGSPREIPDRRVPPGPDGGSAARSRPRLRNELGSGGKPDEQIMAAADRENRIVVSADTDFGELLANAPVLAPSVILLRRTDKQARSLAAVILANLEQVTDDLAAGALIVISDTRIRARRLPMKPSD